MCGYKVCKWCFLGGDRLVQMAAKAQQALAEIRLEVEELKGRVDSDVYAWV
jgi:predicted DsbA family dithiol-disulfide isomerase